MANHRLLTLIWTTGEAFATEVPMMLVVVADCCCTSFPPLLGVSRSSLFFSNETKKKGSFCLGKFIAPIQRLLESLYGFFRLTLCELDLAKLC